MTTKSHVEAMRAAPMEPAEAVAVKPLEWVAGDGITRGKNSWEAADGFGGHYFVIERQWWHSGVWLQEDNMTASDDAAKVAAQAHYEARIRSALATSPARSYADGVNDAAKWHDSEAERLRALSAAPHFEGTARLYLGAAADHDEAAKAIRSALASPPPARSYEEGWRDCREAAVGVCKEQNEFYTAAGRKNLEKEPEIAKDCFAAALSASNTGEKIGSLQPKDAS